MTSRSKRSCACAEERRCFFIGFEDDRDGLEIEVVAVVGSLDLLL